MFQVDAGTLTDASTLTEPEILGPCEPGTAVNLDGIVWHETDTGITHGRTDRTKSLISRMIFKDILDKPPKNDSLHYLLYKCNK